MVTGFRVKSVVGLIYSGTNRVNEITDSIVCRVGFFWVKWLPYKRPLWCIQRVRAHFPPIRLLPSLPASVDSRVALIGAVQNDAVPDLVDPPHLVKINDS